MKSVLSKSQVSEISKLIDKKGVIFHDLNIEMTDHVASEIEEILHNNKMLFEEALSIVFARYDRFHFMRLEEEKTKYLQKQAWTTFRANLLTFFTLPRIVITAVVFLIAFSLLNFVKTYNVFQFVAVLTSVIFLYLSIKKWKLLGWKKYIYLNRFTLYSIFLFQFVYQVLFALKSSTNIYLGASTITFVFLITYCLADLYNEQLTKLKCLRKAIS